MADPSVQVTAPSPDEAAEMGIRDWPQQLKKGVWDEIVAEDRTVIRYVLDGTGSVEIIAGESEATQTAKVGPGTLVEVTGKASLSWKIDTNEMIILTPGFEEGGTLLAVAVAVIGIFGALLAGVGSN